MELNADFSAPVLVHSDTLDWQASPMAGVHRRMLDRIGGEVARATSIVRYAAGSRFSAHSHTGGEEFIVLAGVFQDEHGDYPAGTYVRNPPTSSHTPGSDAGCVIFVKLWQFDPDDRTAVRTDMTRALAAPLNGVARAVLHRDPRETVEHWALDAGASVTLSDAGGIEVLVLSGAVVTAGGDTLRAGGWLRLPQGARIDLQAQEPCKLWSKTGHLPFAKAPTL